MILDNDLMDLWLMAGMVGLDEDAAKRLIEEVQALRSRVEKLEGAVFLIGKAAVRAANTAHDLLDEEAREDLVGIWDESELLTDEVDA